MKIYILIFVLMFGLFACNKKADNEVVIGQIDTLHSEILGESRKIWVHIPENYKNADKSKKYPVLYLLDGDGHFYSVTGMIRQLSEINGNTVVPEMIVVAIPNTDRSRDLTPTKVDIDFFTGDSIQYNSGGNDRFLDFIEKELIPYINQTYPAAPYRTFVGHSFGGLSVINALITRPNLFNNYIAIDPSLWWDNQAFLHHADSVLTTENLDNKSLFVGVANTMSEGMDTSQVKIDTTESTAHIRSILQFVKSVENKDNGLLFGWKYYDNDDHGSVPLITEYDALRFLFSWYRFKNTNELVDPNSTLSADEAIQLVDTHFKKLSSHLGYEVFPEEGLINNLGYFYISDNKLDHAAAFFDLNIRNYPKSSNVYDSRGDCFLAEGDSVKALEFFRKALEVGHNDYSQVKIDALQKELKK